MFPRTNLSIATALLMIACGMFIVPAAAAQPKRAAPQRPIDRGELKPSQSNSLSGHTQKALTVAFHPNGMHIVSAGDGNQVIIWDRNTGKELTRPPKNWFSDQVRQVAFATRGNTTIFLAACRTLWGNGFGAKHVACVISAPDEQKFIKFPLKSPLSPICLAIDRDSRFLAVGGEDRALRVFDLDSVAQAINNEPRKSEFTSEIIPNASALPEAILGVAFHPSKPLIAVGCRDGTIRTFSVSPDGIKVARSFMGHKRPVTCVTFLPDGKRLLSSSLDGTLGLWDIDTARQVKAHPASKGGLEWVAVNPEGTLIATAHRDHSVRLWHTDSLQEAAVLATHTAPVRCVAFSPDGNQLATAGEDFQVFVWDLYATKPPQPKRQQ